MRKRWVHVELSTDFHHERVHKLGRELHGYLSEVVLHDYDETRPATLGLLLVIKRRLHSEAKRDARVIVHASTSAPIRRIQVLNPREWLGIRQEVTQSVRMPFTSSPSNYLTQKADAHPHIDAE